MADTHTRDRWRTGYRSWRTLASAIQRRSRFRALGIHTAAWFLISTLGPPLSAQDDAASVYERACAACHALDGRGTPQDLVGFDVPVPDFTDCSFASREPAGDWYIIAHEGGPIRAFDRRMPSFSGVLSPSELELAVAHAEAFCANRDWPQGDLNLPRALVTEKAYPEDEAVLSTTMASGTVVNEFLYERRFGARSQVEVNVPVSVQDAGNGWRRGLGDVKAALKHVLSHGVESGHILAVAGEVRLPTGRETEGLGKGVTIFEPVVAYGQILPSDGFLHVQAGAEFPADRDRAANEVFWRTASRPPLPRWSVSRGMGWGATPSWAEISSCCGCSTDSARTWESP